MPQKNNESIIILFSRARSRWSIRGEVGTSACLWEGVRCSCPHTLTHTQRTSLLSPRLATLLSLSLFHLPPSHHGTHHTTPHHTKTKKKKQCHREEWSAISTALLCVLALTTTVHTPPIGTHARPNQLWSLSRLTDDQTRQSFQTSFRHKGEVRGTK